MNSGYIAKIWIDIENRKWKKSVTKGHIHRASIRVKAQSKGLYETDTGLVVCKAGVGR